MTTETVASGWIGVDLDGTLSQHYSAHSFDPKGAPKIGAPIMPMVSRVKRWLDEGKDVRIVTARVARGFDMNGDNWHQISEWVYAVFGRHLIITSEKDPHMTELWDDRAVQVIRNTGVSVEERIEQMIKGISECLM